MRDALTLPALLDAITSGNGGATALIEADTALSFDDLAERSARAAAGLAYQGISRGDRVAIWLPNRSDWLICLFALARLGAIAVSVNTRFKAAEVEDIVGRSGCTALIYEPGFKGIDFDGILAAVDPKAMSSLKLVVSVSGQAAIDLGAAVALHTLGELTDCRAEAPSDARPDDGIVVFTTSGTTSRPKFVLHTQRSLSVHAREVAQAFDYVAQDTVLLQALPLCGTFGLAQAMAGLAAGRPSVLQPAFDAREAVDLIARHKVTSFNGSDDMLARICDASTREELSTVKWCGFAAFTSARVTEFVQSCSEAGVHAAGLYGMSEVQALFARQPLGLEQDERAKAGGALTSPMAEVEVRDPETGVRLPSGQSGELYLKGPSRMCQYMDNEAATASTIGQDGFVRTGDLGHLTEDGRFVFETRMGDGLRLGGFLVNPAEIDAWIERHQDVTACQTVGAVLHDRMQPVSFVIGTEGKALDTQALLDHCRDGLAKFKVPVRVVQIDRFPTTDGPNGEKIQRTELRAMAEEILECQA